MLGARVTTQSFCAVPISGMRVAGVPLSVWSVALVEVLSTFSAKYSLNFAVVSIFVVLSTVPVISVNEVPFMAQVSSRSPSPLQSTFPAKSSGGAVSLAVAASTVKV
jgi:hypothetical protein